MEKSSLKATCLINNYNYEEFVLEAIESALSQTMCFEEIIIVDDKSTDNSIAVIQERYSGSSTIKIVEQEKNQGQLSAFNRGFLESSGDIICFLDADDIYKPGYLATVLQVYQEHAECDCIFSAQENFYGDNHKAEAQQDNSSCRVEDLGYSIISTYFTKVWGGVPTSGISFRRKGLELILPVPYTDDWGTGFLTGDVLKSSSGQ
jgi:glycosyltransferase involved in cell wall biosynthesis